MKTPQSRAQITANLPAEIQQRLTPGGSNIQEIHELINVCRQFPGGLDCSSTTPTELARYHKEQVSLRLYGSQAHREVVKGRVRCQSFPIVVMTSNGEREFPPPLLRRCLRLDIEPPEKDELTRIVTAHLGGDLSAKAGDLIEGFLKVRKEEGHLANDQLLNAVFLLTRGLDFGEQSLEALEKRLFQTLGDADNR